MSAMCRGNRMDRAHHFGSIQTSGGSCGFSWVGPSREGESICGDPGERINYTWDAERSCRQG